MENTTPNKSKKSSYMTLSHERREYVNEPGSLQKFGKIIEENNVNVTTKDLIAELPSYMPYLTKNQQFVFRAYYLRRNTIYEIRTLGGFRNLHDVERPLESATKKIIEFLIEDFGTK